MENDTFVGMHFVKGQECSSGEREVKVHTIETIHIHVYMLPCLFV